ncbi:MAG TPA: efflux RND transporter periplasmic adaptor subunit [Treponemataceae bacterium]|nr:efflux RND transporter periplasmic adaptor subunit [Treponemataceae bacterium]
MNRKLRKSLLIGACVVVLGLGSCIFKPDAVSSATAWEGGASKDTTAVETVTVSRAVLVNSVSASGVVSGINEAIVVSETQGIIRKLSFAIGDKVVAGQELLKVDDSLAALNLERAKDQLSSAQLDLSGTEKLVESGGSSTAALSRARSTESASRSQYETALKTWKDTTLRSPISGIVAYKEDAATIGNILSAFTRVARIVDNSAFRVQVSVGEREIGLIEAGAKARVFVPSALGDRNIDALVSAVGAGADSATGSFPVIVSFDNKWGNLVKSGMSATVEIQVRADEPSLVIPLAALIKRNDRYAVFVEEEGKARIKEVSVGRRQGVRAEINSGLTEGDSLIISALTRLQNGTPVTTTLRGESGTRE